MISVEQWWEQEQGTAHHWLLLGKGPSFENRGQYDLDRFKTIAINHVVREMPVDATSIVNFEVAGDLGDILLRNSRYVLMPRYPHTIPGDGPALLETYFERYPVLQRLSDENRLVWYNLDCDPIVPGSRVIQNGPFSVCILFYLLGALGARRLATLGVDGGASYGATFNDIAARTRLANGMASYDYQFWHMARAVKIYRMRYAPLTDDWRFRILVGWMLARQYLRANPKRAWREFRARREEDRRTRNSGDS